MQKKVLKNASYLVIFACKCRLSLGASRNFRSHSVMLFTTDLKTLILFLSLLKKELCAVRAVSSLFLRLLLVSLSPDSQLSCFFGGIEKQQQNASQNTIEASLFMHNVLKSFHFKKKTQESPS